MKIFVTGASTSKFGELWEVSPRDLAKEVISEALKNAGIEKDQVDALFVGNMLSGILGRQEHLGALYADNFPNNIASFRVEGACASGGLALHNGVNSILAGKYQTVVVLGVEKMTDHQQDEVSSALMAAGSDEERQSGITFPGLYAIMAQAYMQKYNVKEEDLASISVKNHYHGSFNKKAQFPFTVSLDDVMESPKIADPLKLLDCSPISDGASAIVITNENLAKKNKKPVEIAASEVATDTLSLFERDSFTSLGSVVKASTTAYKKVGITSSDIDVAEIHDCFSIAEAIAIEDLGFSKKGFGAKDVASGKYTLGKGKIITNSSGGLKSCGHPIGATGIKQVVEIVEQLRGESQDRQVKNAKIGLTHNVGGSGATAVIHILRI